MTDNVSEQVGDLSGLIQQTAYQSPAVNGTDGVTQGADSTPDGLADQGLSPASENTPAPPATEQQTDVTPPASDSSTGNAPSTPQYTDEQVRQMQEQLVNQQRYINMHAQQVRAEQERQFQASLAEMDETERRAAIAEREANKYRTQAQYLAAQQQREKAAEQEKAKRTLATIVASDNGLPISVSTALLAATSLEHMESMAREIAADLNAGRAPVQEPPAQTTPVQPETVQNTNAAFVAGGDSGSSNTTPKVERGSGDFESLIAQAQYQVIPTF